MRLLIAIAVLASLLPRIAGAAESAAVVSKRVTATLVSDTDAVAPGRPYHVGLRLRLAPGWHTYWINPGEAGEAPELTSPCRPGPPPARSPGRCPSASRKVR